MSSIRNRASTSHSASSSESSALSDTRVPNSPNQVSPETPAPTQQNTPLTRLAGLPKKEASQESLRDRINRWKSPAIFGTWALSNATAAVGQATKVSQGGASDATHLVSQATSGAGMAPNFGDVAVTSLDVKDKAIKFLKNRTDLNNAQDTPNNNALELQTASSELRQAKGNLIRATPGALRDIGLGTVNLIDRGVAAAHAAGSVYPAAVAPAAREGIAAAGGAMFVAGSIMLNQKTDRGVDRAYRVQTAALRPASQRADEARLAPQAQATAKAIDTLYEDGKFSPNTYSILRDLSPEKQKIFADNFSTLGITGQKRLNHLLHFSGERNAMQVLNMGRTTNLNTASVRREARAAAIDQFVEENIQAGSRTAVFNRMATARSEALGARISPKIESTRTALLGRNVSLAKDGNVYREAPGIAFSHNTLSAISRAGKASDFAHRYSLLLPDDRRRLHRILSFDAWRFWKADATLPTTKAKRADIRQALVTRFAEGETLDNLATLKTRYNQANLPLRTGRTPEPTATDLMRQHILGAQNSALDTLREEKRHSKIQIGYGATTTALAVGELALGNPLAASGFNVTRLAASPVYLAYSALRSAKSGISSRHKKDIDTTIKKESDIATEDEAAREHAKHLAKDNPIVAVKLFVEDLFSSGDPGIKARNMLRDFRFTETQLRALREGGKEKAAAYLEKHLLGEDLRRRFSDLKLDKTGIRDAAQLADRMHDHAATPDEPLTWRERFEAAGARVIDNGSTPGLDSMLHALYQQLSGHAESSSSAASRAIMGARRRIVGEIAGTHPDAPVDIWAHTETIAKIASETFGKPNAAVKIVCSDGKTRPQTFGSDGNSPIDAVLCIDVQTHRTFGLYGGNAEHVSEPAPQIAPLGLGEAFTQQSLSDALHHRQDSPHRGNAERFSEPAPQIAPLELGEAFTQQSISDAPHHRRDNN